MIFRETSQSDVCFMMGEHTTQVLVHLASGIRVEGATNRTKSFDLPVMLHGRSYCL